MDALVALGSLIGAYWLWYAHLRVKGWKRWSSIVLCSIAALFISSFTLAVYQVGNILAGLVVFSLFTFAPLRRLWREHKARTGTTQPHQPAPVSAPLQGTASLDSLRNQCRELLAPGALTADAAGYLLLALRDAPGVAKDTGLSLLRYELEEALEDGALSHKEKESLRFWIANACGEDADLPPDMADAGESGFDEDDDAEQDPREAYLLEHATLSTDGRYTFDYEDARGNRSSRQVDILYIDGDYVEAYDHDAGAMRTFRKSRILGAVTDTDTGELFRATELTRKRLSIKRIDFDALGM